MLSCEAIVSFFYFILLLLMIIICMIRKIMFMVMMIIMMMFMVVMVDDKLRNINEKKGDKETRLLQNVINKSKLIPTDKLRAQLEN